MAVRVDIGLDLGNNTLKVAYALKKAGDSVEYGKLSISDSVAAVAIPAVAFYDEFDKQWLFADEVDRSGNTSFINVVKIKNLMSLLQHNGDEGITERNREYYRNGDRFPKFYFPLAKKVLDDFDEMVKSDSTFEAPDWTPRSVCEAYFKYVAGKVFCRLEYLKSVRGISGKVETRLAIVYPPKVGKEYVDEFKRIAELAFGKTVHRSLSSTKALGMFAWRRGAIDKGEHALVFDMGDEDISVARVGVETDENGGDTIVIDGADGHSDPLSVGGQNVDESIEAYIERLISGGETMGTPSSGEDGHIVEHGLHSRQYLFMKDIKKAKVILSRELRPNSLFIDGAPVTIYRSSTIQRKITREMFTDCLGTKSNSGIAKTVCDYIIDEIKRPVNRGIKKIFLSGGLTETYSLLEYIGERIAQDKDTCEVEIRTFDDYQTADDKLTILSHEDSVYAPAVGGAIVSALDIDVRTALSLTYGTWVVVDGVHKVLCIFAEKGKLLDPEKPTPFSTHDMPLSGTGVADEEMYSCALSKDDIAKKAVAGLDYYDKTNSKTGVTTTYLRVGELKGDSALVERRNTCMRIGGLKTVAGGLDSCIKYFYKGRRVELLDKNAVTTVRFKEGILVSPDGRAKPIIENVSSEFGYVNIAYINDDKQGTRTNESQDCAPAAEIDIVFEGVESFVATEGD